MTQGLLLLGGGGYLSGYDMSSFPWDWQNLPCYLTYTQLALHWKTIVLCVSLIKAKWWNVNIFTSFLTNNVHTECGKMAKLNFGAAFLSPAFRERGGH